MRFSSFAVILTVIAVCFSVPSVLGQSPSKLKFTYTTVDYPGAGGTSVFAINNSGQLTGNWGPGRILWRGFFFDGITFTDLTFPAHAIQAAPGDINDSAIIVGSFSLGSTGFGYLYSNGNHRWVNYPGADFTIGLGINNVGDVVGAYTAPCCVGHAFSLHAKTYTNIDVPGAEDSSAVAINLAGTIVGWYRDASDVIHGFLLKDGAYSTVDFPGAASTQVLGINANEDLVGRITDQSGHYHGFLFSGGTFLQIDIPGQDVTQAFGINDLGSIVGSYTDSAKVQHGFILSTQAKPHE
jgi:uncharacterized membrane protein